VHVAAGTAVVVGALVLARRALVAAAAVGTVAIAAARLYLHGHPLSDVVGGLALGVTVRDLLLRR
jgi:membrane-associated phospholipid phosphatase